MKKLLVLLCAIITVSVYATTINLNWIVDGSTYAQTTCETGSDLILPTPTPTKRGYHFVGWDNYYIKLDYIESTGTQYINTGVTNYPLEYEIKLQYTDTNKTQTIIGTSNLNDTTGTNAYEFQVGSLNDGSIYLVNTAVNISSVGASFGDIYTVTGSINNPSYVKFSTSSNSSVIEIVVEAERTLVPIRPILLFNRYASNARVLGTYGFKGRFYYVKIRDSNNTIIRNLLPAKRSYDNEIGMYDTVSDTFFTNAGTGAFIAGPVSVNQTWE